MTTSDLAKYLMTRSVLSFMSTPFDEVQHFSKLIFSSAAGIGIGD